MKTCPTCNTSKPELEFYKNHRPCKDCCKAKTKAWKQANSEKAKAHHRRYILKTSYGITPEDFDSLLQAQKGLCALCRDNKATRIDHDHVTGKVRGLLCNGCNIALHLLDDPKKRTQTLEYLGLTLN